MNLRALDLNLLVVFDAVRDTRSVTLAASKLNMAQSSVSHALRRLRDTLQDELFLCTPDGMVPTPKAEQLAEPIRAALKKLREALVEKGSFIPERAERRFILMMNNRAALTLAAPLAAVVTTQAPAVILDIRPSGSRDVLTPLDRGDADLLIGGIAAPNDRFSCFPLLEDRYVAVLRKTHEMAGLPTLSMADLAVLPHLVLSSTGDHDNFVDDVLAEHGFKRRIVLHTTLLAAAATLRQSDMVMVMSERAAREFARTAEIHVMELPFRSPVLTTTMLWHRRFDGEPAHQWLRKTIETISRSTLSDRIA
jgi:DNA-binding transcriptional LysR family regulator